MFSLLCCRVLASIVASSCFETCDSNLAHSLMVTLGIYCRELMKSVGKLQWKVTIYFTVDGLWTSERLSLLFVLLVL
jgi:hypothetical protein